MAFFNPLIQPYLCEKVFPQKIDFCKDYVQKCTFFSLAYALPKIWTLSFFLVFLFFAMTLSNFCFCAFSFPSSQPFYSPFFLLFISLLPAVKIKVQFKLFIKPGNGTLISVRRIGNRKQMQGAANKMLLVDGRSVKDLISQKMKNKKR